MDHINYTALIDEAMHIIVKKSLELAVDNKLPGEHHFFISFSTTHPGVSLSKKLKKKYPKEMTIVLQYQFEELIVEDKQFSVVLSFDNIREKIVVPFIALTAFADPSVKFGLQFHHMDDLLNKDDFEDFSEEPEDENDDVNAPITKDIIEKSGATNVILASDKFRNKKK